MAGRSSSFELLHPKVQKWVWGQNWSALQTIQESTIPYVLKADRDLVISASTGGGKTEAVFLPILSRILESGSSSGGYAVLYISPLKALINDQYRRLQDMTKDMGIPVTPWHGDVSASVKTNSLKHPSGILIITPESLEAMLMNRKQTLHNSFDGLMYVVIDEFHSLLGFERGKQLQSLLSRLENYTGRKVPHIAMSATLSDYEAVERFLRPDGSMPCTVPECGESDHEIKILLKEYIITKQHDSLAVEDEISEDIYNKLRGTNNLVFANSRVDVEAYSVALAEKCEKNNVPNEFRTHHGSISKVERESVEHELLDGSYPVTAVCTCTLELGIDIGKVKSIAQIGSCSSVSSIRQRLGRSGRRGEASILRIYSHDSEEEGFLYELRHSLVQNIAVVELIREKKYEKPCISAYHFSTLVQQILSCLTQYGGFSPKDGWLLLCKNGAFRNVSSTMFLDLLKFLGEKKVLAMTHNGLVVIGEEGERIVRQTDFYAAFKADREISVVNRKNGKEIGTVQNMEEVGVMILLGGRRWMVEESDIKAKRLIVSLVKDGGRASYVGGGAPLDRLIAEKMQEVLEADEIYPYLDKNTAAIQALEEARTFYRANHLDNPTVRGFKEVITMTWGGDKINQTIHLCANLYLDKAVKTTAVSVSLSIDDMVAILSKGKPKAEDLAALLPREIKCEQKYDEFLPDNLLDLEYGASMLDVDGAWEVMERIVSFADCVQ